MKNTYFSFNLRFCADSDVNKCAKKVYEKVVTIAKDLVPTAKKLEKSYGIPIVNKRVSVTPVSFLASAFTKPNAVPIAKALDFSIKKRFEWQKTLNSKL